MSKIFYPKYVGQSKQEIVSLCEDLMGKGYLDREDITDKVAQQIVDQLHDIDQDIFSTLLENGSPFAEDILEAYRSVFEKVHSNVVESFTKW